MTLFECSKPPLSRSVTRAGYTLIEATPIMDNWKIYIGSMSFKKMFDVLNFFFEKEPEGITP
jgi:hypothetical protein